MLHDHVEYGKHTAADVVAKAQAVLSESELLRAMLDVGYFPPNTPAAQTKKPRQEMPGLSLKSVRVRVMAKSRAERLNTTIVTLRRRWARAR
jgi:hypothetical protein